MVYSVNSGVGSYTTFDLRCSWRKREGEHFKLKLIVAQRGQIFLFKYRHLYTYLKHLGGKQLFW